MGANVTPKQRVLYIDCLKGFATILVVIGHVFDGYIKSGLFKDQQDIMCGGYNVIYSFHMALFFMISGFVYVKAYVRNGEVKPTVKKQILNIIVIYIVFSILFGLFKCFLGKYTNSEVVPKDILMIWMKPIYPYWYLYVLVFYYLIFQIKAFYKVNPFVVLLPLVLIAFVCNYIPTSTGKYFEIKHFLYFWLFFGLGVMLSYNDEWYKKHEIFIALPMFLFSVGYSYKDFYTGKTLGGRKCNFAVAIGICLILFYIFRLLFSDGKSSRVRFMGTLGQYSLEIYVIHCVFTAGNRVVLSKLGIDYFWLNIILNIVISIAIPVIIAIICKKLNIHKYIFRPVYAVSELRKKNQNEI